jgi:hypothetical protein
MSTDQPGLATYEPTQEDLAFYRDHGYWISPVIIPDAILDAAERGIDRFYASDVDQLLDVDRIPPGENPDGDFSHWGWRPEDGNIMRKNFYSALRVRELAQLAHYPDIARCAAGLSASASLA